MADTKITALAVITTVDPANDVLPIVDVSDHSMAASGTTCRVTTNQLLQANAIASLASATISGDLTVDTSTLKVDSANNRVGIGTATPARPLDIVGSFQSSLGWVLTGTPAGLGAATRYIGGASTTDSWYYNAVTGGSHLWAFGESLAMTLNSNGLGIGVTPSAWGNAYKVVQTGQALGVYGRANLGYYGTKFNLYNDNTNDVAITTNYVGEYRFELLNGSHVWLNKSSAGTAGVNQTLTQAMTLDASGNLLVKKTASGVTTLGVELLATGQINGATANQDNLNIYNTTAAAYRFYVNAAGTVFATNTTISAISDARFKENVQDIDVGLGAILALKPRKFDWKDGKGKNIKGDRGFIAQEFETVFPNLIDEWKENAPEGEAPYKSVRQDLIPVLVKAIQELAAEVNALKNA